MTTHQKDITIKVDPVTTTMTMDLAPIRANYGDCIKWKSINGIPFEIEFKYNCSPGLKLKYTSDLDNEVILTVMYDPKVAGARKFEYTVRDKNPSPSKAADIDPDIIIPPLGLP